MISKIFIVFIIILSFLILFSSNRVVDFIDGEDSFMIAEQYINRISDLESHITMLEKEITRTSEVKITFYAPELKGINSDSDPTKTAIMQEPVPGWTVAISRDLVAAGWLGRKIWIKGLGVRYASDIMADSYNGVPIRKQIDICVGKNDIVPESQKLGNNINILATVL